MCIRYVYKKAELTSKKKKVIISFHVLFWIFDRLPFFYLAFSVGCHVVYSLNLKTFPFISLTSVPFVGSCSKCVFIFIFARCIHIICSSRICQSFLVVQILYNTLQTFYGYCSILWIMCMVGTFCLFYKSKCE